MDPVSADFLCKPNKSNKCLCCSQRKTEVLTPLSTHSLECLKYAAKIRQDNLFEANVGNSVGESYHRSCYQSYTNKNHLQRMTHKRKSESNNLEGCPEKKYLRSAQLSFDDNICIICQQHSKSIKSSNGGKCKEELIISSDPSKITTAANTHGDHQLVIHMAGKREIKYHKSCYRKYTRSSIQMKGIESKKQNNEEHHTADDAFGILVKELDESLFTKMQTISMYDIVQRYLTLSRQYENAEPNYSPQSHTLKKKIIQVYGGRVSFWKPPNRCQSEVIYSAEVPNVNKCDQDEEHETLQDYPTDTIQAYHTAQLIRSDVMNMKSEMSWPPTSEDLSQDNVKLPNSLYNVLAWILSGKAEYISEETKVNLPAKVHKQVLSIGQDIVYCCSHGRIKTPKHVSLPITVKSLTGSTELITILSHFGHCVSYSQVEEIETALAEKEIAKRLEQDQLPGECDPNVDIVCCWDNNDIMEETLSGKETTHCTNGIVIQTKPHGCKTKPMCNTMQRTRRRHLKDVNQPQQQYHRKPREDPPPSPNAIFHLQEVGGAVSSQAEKIDFAWFLSQLPLTGSLLNLVTNYQQVSYLYFF